MPFIDVNFIIICRKGPSFVGRVENILIKFLEVINDRSTVLKRQGEMLKAINIYKFVWHSLNISKKYEFPYKKTTLLTKIKVSNKFPKFFRDSEQAVVE